MFRATSDFEIAKSFEQNTSGSSSAGARYPPPLYPDSLMRLAAPHDLCTQMSVDGPELTHHAAAMHSISTRLSPPRLMPTAVRAGLFSGKNSA